MTDVLHLENYYKRIRAGEKKFGPDFQLHVSYQGTDLPVKAWGGFFTVNITEEQARAVNDRAEAEDRREKSR